MLSIVRECSMVEGWLEIRTDYNKDMSFAAVGDGSLVSYLWATWMKGLTH